ncbi:MAG: hypothetical protein A2007_02710 [Verrucomicrobia bacterium GWC2_42_7]|nr:MAG: hypothetical protein A2007_02710 [Verrucomicrobia bacterium GWC2_42_7]
MNFVKNLFPRKNLLLEGAWGIVFLGVKSGLPANKFLRILPYEKSNINRGQAYGCFAFRALYWIIKE